MAEEWWRGKRPNWVTRFEWIPCLSGPLLYLETFVPVALQGAWIAYSPGWKDVVRMTTGRSWSHHVRRQAREAERVEANWITKTGRWASDLLPKIDRALWFLAVEEALEFTLSHWVSMAFKLKPCPAEPAKLEGSSHNPIDGRPFDHDWMVGPHFFTEAGNITPYLGGTLIIPRGWGGGMFCAATFNNLFTGDPLHVAMRMLNASGGQFDYDKYGPRDEDGRDQGPCCFANVRPARVAQQIRCQVQLAPDEYPLVWLATRGYCKEWLYPDPSLHEFDIKRDLIKIADSKKRSFEREMERAARG